jgi:hypothetical protein
MNKEMLNFSMLSLNENDMPEMPEIFQDNNDILNSETMEDLFINIYSYENPDISFELLRQKLINYYFDEATDECISKHLSVIIDISDPLIISNIGRIGIYNNYEENYNLNMIIDFISSPYGTDYLHHIYHIFISPI